MALLLKRRLRNRYAIAFAQALIVVRHARDYVDMWVDADHGRLVRCVMNSFNLSDDSRRANNYRPRAEARQPASKPTLTAQCLRPVSTSFLMLETERAHLCRRKSR